MELYFKEFYLTHRENALFHTNWPVSNPVLELEQNLRVDRYTFLRSDFYNTLWRLAEIHERLSVLVREVDRKHGVLHIYRAPGEPPCSS
jgi:hypothetical protein